MQLRVLFVEDNPDDVELMLRRLREAGIEAQWQRVESAAALREALAAEPWQVALVDFNLPSFSGPQAIGLLAELAPDTPAITVSGAISEETAVATITAGAVDYVLKDNLTRLAPAALRAVEGAELRRKQRQAAAQARQTMYAVEHSSQAILYISEDGTVLYANEAAASLGGVAAREAVGSPIRRWVPLLDEQRLAALWRAAEQHPIVDFEATLRLPSGQERLISATLDHHQRDAESFVIVYARDVTEQRAAEERAVETEARYARLAENARDIIFRYDFLPSPGLTYINPAVQAITGYTSEECYADPQLMFTMVHPDDSAAMAELMTSLTPPDEPLLMRWIGKDGVTRWMESRLVPLRDDEGRLLAVEGITRDVSERKRAEEELRFTKFMVEQAGDLVFWMTPDGVFKYANSTALETLGYSLEELCAMTIHDIDPDFPAQRWPEHMRALEQAGALTFETRHRARDGAIIPMEVTEMYFEFDGDVYDVGFARDITERKRAEDELQLHAMQLRTILESTGDGILAIDDAGRVIKTNQRFADLWHLPADLVETGDDEALLTYVLNQLVDPDAFLEKVHALYASIAVDLDTILFTDGRIVERYSCPLLNEGVINGRVWSFRDITARKHAEEEVRRQAEQLTRTVEGAVLAMSHMVESRDPYTAGHERRVSELATAIAVALGMTGAELTALRLAGLIHDIGKIAVPAEILAKPGRLSEVEFNLIRQHPQSGFEILGAIDFGGPVAEMVLQHHERLDGSGYPRALAAPDILREARILAVADVVEAMSSHRPYRAALGMEAALAEVRGGAGEKYDADVVAACVRLFEEQGFALTP